MGLQVKGQPIETIRSAGVRKRTCLLHANYYNPFFNPGTAVMGSEKGDRIRIIVWKWD